MHTGEDTELFWVGIGADGSGAVVKLSVYSVHQNWILETMQGDGNRVEICLPENCGDRGGGKGRGDRAIEMEVLVTIHVSKDFAERVVVVVRESKGDVECLQTDAELCIGVRARGGPAHAFVEDRAQRLHRSSRQAHAWPAHSKGLISEAKEVPLFLPTISWAAKVEAILMTSPITSDVTQEIDKGTSVDIRIVVALEKPLHPLEPRHDLK